MIESLEIIKILWVVTLSGLILFMIMRFYFLRWWNLQKSNSNSKFDFKVKVIVPCRGSDVELDKNLQSIKNQKYTNFSLVAIVDSEKDEACKVIEKNNISMILSTYESKGSGKVRAISTAIAQDENSDVFVLVDSDTRVDSDWLSGLVAPLEDKNIGAVSTYPVYEPIGKPTIWDYIKKVWGYVGINMMEFRPTRFVWGGSVAFRKDFLSSNDFVEFSSSISDDATLTKLCREKSLSIAYAKGSTPKIYSAETRKTFMEWSNRQIAITLSYSRSAFYAALIIYGFTTLYLCILIPLSFFVWNMFLLGYIPGILLILFNMMREKRMSVGLAIATLLVPFIYIVNMIHGARNREINWRGNTYQLDQDKI